MNRSLLALIAIFALTTPLVASALDAPRATPVVTGQPDFPTLAQWGAEHPGEWPASAGTTAADPVRAAEQVMNDMVTNGRTPHDWLAYARTFNLDAPASVPAAPADPDGARLVAAVLRLDAALALPATPADRLVLQTQATGLRPDVRAAFADLVTTVASAYEKEIPLARAIQAQVPAPSQWTVHTVLATPEQRDAMAANAHDVLAALKLFQARTAGVWKTIPASPAAAGSDAPLFSDPEGLVILGGTGDGTYARGGVIADAILIVEPSGNDVYLDSAGGACPDATNLIAKCNLLAMSIVFDMAGDDQYTITGPTSFTQGAGGLGGIGMLVDVAGNDTYTDTEVKGATGAIFMYIDGGMQGYALGGFGLLLDGAGDDTYEADVQSTNGHSVWDLAQGFGSAGGLGMAIDLGGSDHWLSNSLGITGGTNGFVGVYPLGTGFYGGVGLLLDLGRANDVYASIDRARTTDFYAFGFAAFGGTGIQLDDGGNDDYTAISDSSAPFINPLLNCDFGSASYGGFGIFLDTGGNDRYFADTVSPRGAYTMIQGFGGPAAGYGLFVDTSGNDQHLEYAHGGTESRVAGRGVLVTQGPLNGEGNIVGTFVDSGGADTYAGPGANNAEWTFGADADVVPNL